jgi:hypothetical protein
MQGHVTDGDIAELVGRTAEAASAYIRGDIRRYLMLIKPTADNPMHGGAILCLVKRRYRTPMYNVVQFPSWDR